MSSTIDFKVDMLKDVKTVYKELKAEQKKKMGLVMRDCRRDVPQRPFQKDTISKLLK